MDLALAKATAGHPKESNNPSLSTSGFGSEEQTYGASLGNTFSGHANFACDRTFRNQKGSGGPLPLAQSTLECVFCIFHNFPAGKLASE